MSPETKINRQIMFALADMEFQAQVFGKGEGSTSLEEDFLKALGVHALTLEQYYDWWSDYHKQWHVRLLRAYHWIRCISNRVTELLLRIGVIKLPF